MGVETAVIAGLSVASAIGNYNQSKSESRQTAKEGVIAAQNRADEIKKLASRQRVSYLQAGLELEGTPQNVINDTYETGIADVNNIIGAYNQKSKNIMTKARADLLGGLAKAGASAFAGGGSLEDMGGEKTFTSRGYLNGLIGGNITGTVPVPSRKPLFARSI